MGKDIIKKARPLRILLLKFFKSDQILDDNSLPALNLATFFALILITAPVWGLRPLRAALLDTEKVPKPTRVTLFPDFRVLVTASTKESRQSFAWVFVMPASSAIFAINSALFMVKILVVQTSTNLEAFCNQQNFFRKNISLGKCLKSASGLCF
jgi:putative acetyltransferase